MESKMDIKLMPEAELTQLLAQIATKDVDAQVRLYLKLRQGKGAIKKHLDAVENQYKLVMETIENHLLAKADKAKVTGFTVNGVATTYTAETRKVSIADDEAFFNFVLDKKDLSFFERRVAVTHLEEYLKENGGVNPPGLNVFRERVMRVRKAGEKA
jgi:hypothetical protein